MMSMDMSMMNLMQAHPAAMGGYMQPPPMPFYGGP